MNSSSPRPHHLHGFAGGLGQARCFNGRFAGVLAAVSAAHVGLDHADLCSGQMKGLHQLVAHAEGPLRAGPDRELAVVPLGDRGARFQRSVRDVLDGVLSFELHIGAGKRICNRAGNMIGASSCSLRIVLEVFEEALVALLVGNVPLGLDRRERMLCGECIAGHHAGEIAVAHDFYAGHLFRGAGVERLQRCVESFRPQHRAKHHLRAARCLKGIDACR